MEREMRSRTLASRLFGHGFRGAALDSSAGDSGAMASRCVVGSGFALTMFLFYLLRIGPAHRLATGAVSKAVVKPIWNNCRQGLI
jgi:hypothetical protein